jgi:DNA-binding response OmpR family regulator
MRLGGPSTQPEALKMEARIMVIDDEPGIRALLAALLEDAGFDVVTAADGHTGLQLMRRACPDMAILDYMLPGITGGEVLRQMRASTGLRGVPVLLMSAGQGVEAQARRGPLTDFMAKPFDIDALVRTVTEMIQAARPNRGTAIAAKSSHAPAAGDSVAAR